MHLPIMGSEPPGHSQRIYIGTYTGPKSQGIYTANFDAATGKLSPPELAASSKNPTFLALHPKRPVLYAVEEISDFRGGHEGGVSAFSIDRKTGRLTLLNQQPSGGAGPCHLCVDRTGSWLVVANYNTGSVAEFPLESDGRLGALSAVVQHNGSSINHERQSGPHAHFVATDPSNKLVMVCDLGLDQVLTYNLLPSERKLPLHAVDSIKPGSGPRHLVFSPNGRFVYLINELSSTLITYALNDRASAGHNEMLEEVQTVSLLPPDFNGSNIAAEVQVHPSGRFVYGSNRGHNSIAVFAADAKTGRLTAVEIQPTLGRTPRHFTFDPSGQWLLVENQDSNNIVVFRVDPMTGRLTSSGEQIEVGAPVCLVFVPREE
jgi:6-phosphogluconolactonase